MALPANRVISILGVMLALAGAALWMGRDQLISKPDAQAAPSEFSRLAEPSGDRQAIVTGLFQGALLSAADGTDFGEGSSYLRLVQHVRAMPAEDFTARLSGRLNWEDALARPAQWRGEFVRVRGLCARMETVKLRGADESMPDIYRGYISQTDMTSEPVAFDCVVPPGNVVPKTDVLDVEGVFYRTVRYQTKSGETREIPYLIVRNLSVYQPPVTQLEPGALLLRIGLVALAAVAAALIMLRLSSRRRPPVPKVGKPGMREMVEARVREDQLKPKRP